MQGAVEYQGMHRDGGVEIKTADGPCTLQSVALHYDTFVVFGSPLTWLHFLLLRGHNRHSQPVAAFHRSQLPDGGQAW